MPCNLIIGGNDFDVSAFIESTGLQVVKRRSRGEARSSLKPDGEKLPWSFLVIETSKVDFNNFNEQVKDTIEYFKEYRDQLLYINNIKGIDHRRLDFGVDLSNAQFLQSLFIPVELVNLAAEFGIGIQISVYNALDE